MSLRLSQLKSQRKGAKKVCVDRIKKNCCVKCGQPVNHVKARCDYCYLNDRIRALEKNYGRLLKIL